MMKPRLCPNGQALHPTTTHRLPNSIITVKLSCLLFYYTIMLFSNIPTQAPSSSLQSQTDEDCSLGIQMVLFILEYIILQISNREISFHDLLFPPCSLLKSPGRMLCSNLLQAFKASMWIFCNKFWQTISFTVQFSSCRFYCNGTVVCLSV